MAIDKVTPQKLNSSVDARYRSNTDMSDALNINFGEDHKSNSGDSTSGGDLGVLKPTPSNALVENSTLSSNSRVIGSVTDDVLGIIFFFVWAANADEMGVWAYDRDGILPGSSPDSYVEVLTSSRFGFPASGFVDADVVHIGQKYSSDNRDIQGPIYSDDSADSSDKSCVLYFTDNVNEPRKLDVYRAMTSDLSGYGVYDINDLIKACPRTPLEPITFQFSTDPERQISNFDKIPGVQFAYQFLYRGGVDSPISTYSRLGIPIEYIQRGVQSVPILTENVCILTIPSVSAYSSEVKNITKEVNKIRLLVRFGNTGGWKIIEEVESNVTSYPFHNDRVLIPVSKEETAMHFSGLPRKAKSQAIASDRLIYANYLEGFDNVKCSGTALPIYKEVSQDVAQIEINVVPYILQPLKTDLPSGFDGTEQKIAGYKIDTGGVPWGELPENSVISISFSCSTENNYHIYDYQNSFHANNQVGSSVPTYADGSQYPIGNEISTQEYTVQSNFMLDNLLGGKQIFGGNNGVGFTRDENVEVLEPNSVIYNEWVSFNPYGDGEEIITPVVHGTSAATPLVIQGGVLDFKVSFKTNYPISNEALVGDLVSTVRLTVRDTIYFLLAGIGEMPNSLGTPFATVQNPLEDVKKSSSYSFDFGVDSGEYRGPEYSSGNTISFKNNFPDSLVCALSDKILPNQAEADINVLLNSPPVGYFAIIKADVTMGLTSMKNTMNERYAEDFEFFGDTEDAYLALEVQALENPVIRTCIPVLNPNVSYGNNTSVIYEQDELVALNLAGWSVRTDEEISQDLASDFQTQFPLSNAHPNIFHIKNEDIESQAEIDFEDTTSPGSTLTPIQAFGVNTENERLKVVGYLRSSASFVESEPPKLLLTSEEIVEYREEIYFLYTEEENDSDLIRERFKFSLLDGNSVSDINGSAAFLGWMHYSGYPEVNDSERMLRAFQLQPNGSYSFPWDLGIGTGEGFLNSSIRHSWVEVLSSTSYSFAGGNLSNFRSFKTYSNHDFGIIYYDERGRSSLVNYLTSAYVGGYSDLEPSRDGNKGRVQIAIQIDNSPPSWAHSYQLAYGGNSSITDFIQYAAGQAFVDIINPDLDGLNGTIYVSLSLLQGANGFSYTDSWGAVNKDGGKSLYTYSTGDKLRILYYHEAGETVYPHNYEFEVLGVKTMVSNATENFFQNDNDGTTVLDYKQGEFVMLRNNPEATGFSYANIYEGFTEEEGFQSQTYYNKWSDNTVVEIYSPKKSIDVESRLYYEIGDKYNVTSMNGSLFHQTNPLLTDDGDVFWRKVPVKFNKLLSSGIYSYLFQSSFKNYYLETESFTDLFPGANGKNYGKPKIMFSSASESRNRSSVTFSEKNNYSSRFNIFTRFNLTILPFKDLPNEYGSIQSLVNEYDSILVIQENKISAIPVERNILSTAGGSTSLIASGKVLGTQKFYAGDYGCDTNPESVTRAGTSVYFASKKRKEVYMYSPNQGVSVVSDVGMKTFFYSLFSNAMANADNLGVVRVVGGYDPLKDEFLLSVINDTDPILNDGENGGGLGGGGFGMITIEGGDLGDIIPINLSVSGEYDGSIEDVTYDDDGNSSDLEISILEADLAAANNTITQLLNLVDILDNDLLLAIADLGEMNIFFTNLLGDESEGALFESSPSVVNLPNGVAIYVTSYTQYIGAVATEVANASALVSDLQDKIIDTNFQIGQLYNSFISNTNNFISLTESYQTVLLELELTAESAAIDTFLAEIENLIPGLSSSNVINSEGNSVSIIETNAIDDSWMVSINSLTSSINTLFQGIPEGATGFAGLITTAIQNLDTTNANLVSAFRGFIQSITSVTKQDGSLLFGDAEIGARLEAFLDGTGLDGLDFDGDGVFTNAELNALPTVNDTTTKFQNALDNYINGLTVVNTNLSSFIDDLLAVANESDYGYVDQFGNPITLNADNAQMAGVGFASYIDFLESKLTIAQGDAFDATTSLEEANQSLSDLRGDVVDSWNAGVANGSLTYNDIVDGGTAIAEFNESILGNLRTSSAASHSNVTDLSTRIATIETHLTTLHDFLLNAGYASTNTLGFNASGEADVKLGFLINSVDKGLIELRAFQEMFGENSFQFGRPGFYRRLPGGNEQLITDREVTASSIQDLTVEALEGVKNAMDTIQLALESSGVLNVDAPASYLSPNIRSLLQGSGETITTTASNLTQYIRANGITMEEYSDFSKNAQSDEGMDELTWTSLSIDANSDNSIGVVDLLQLLSVYGNPVLQTATRYTYKTNAAGELETDEDGSFILEEFTPTN